MKVVFVVGRARIPGRCVYVARLALGGALIEGAVLARVRVLLVVVHCRKGKGCGQLESCCDCFALNSYSPFSCASNSSTQYFMLSSLDALYQTSVLSTFDSGGIGRNPSPASDRDEGRKQKGFF